MTGMSILHQAYSLMEQTERLTTDDHEEMGLIAVNQIYGELWHREHRTAFIPLDNLRRRLDFSWRMLPAMTYGVAMLLSLNEDAAYERFQALYQRAAAHAGGLAPLRRMDILPREVAE